MSRNEKMTGEKEKKEKESKKFWIGGWFVDLDRNIARSMNGKIMTANEFSKKLCEIILKTFPVSREEHEQK